MILIIDDDIAVRTSLHLLLSSRKYEVEECETAFEALRFLTHETPDLIILDLNFSLDTSGVEGLSLLRKIRSLHNNIPVILITGWGSIEVAVDGMKLGANDFITKPWENDHLINSIKTLLDLKPSRTLNPARKDLDLQYSFSHIVGEDRKILSLLETVGRVASTDASVLIMGESGTGKELIAEAIHLNSLRKSKAFIKVNLGGISTSLFESEMFGHVRGAFTDAKSDRIGRFEMANKGTIFLDEIGDLDFSSQVKLLRVLQDRTYEILGSSRTKTLDVRIICATNRDLNEMVQQGKFREDLFYRINLITLKLPALRERPDDIPILANHFLNNFKEIYNRPNLKISKESTSWLKQLSLPGNIRQLKNLVERSLLVSKNDLLNPEDFKLQLDQSPGRKGSMQLPDVGTISLEQIEISMIKKALEFHNNKISKTSLALGITRSSLYRRLEKYNIPYDKNSD